MSRGNPVQGSISILIVLIMLALSVFGVLSLVSAYSDYKLAEKSADTLLENYQLDARGQKELALLTEQLSGTGLTPSQLNELGWQRISDAPYVLGKTLDQGRAHLRVEVELTMRDESSRPLLTVVRWQRSQDEFDYSGALDIWEG